MKCTVIVDTNGARNKLPYISFTFVGQIGSGFCKTHHAAEAEFCEMKNSTTLLTTRFLRVHKIIYSSKNYGVRRNLCAHVL